MSSGMARCGRRGFTTSAARWARRPGSASGGPRRRLRPRRPSRRRSRRPQRRPAAGGAPRPKPKSLNRRRCRLPERIASLVPVAVKARRKRTRRPQLWASERMVRGMGYAVVAGIDEVGLGPLAGPAVAAACVLPIGARLPGLDDSKKLEADERERLDRAIRRRAVAFGICAIPPDVIDGQGLTRARQLAMTGAVS